MEQGEELLIFLRAAHLEPGAANGEGEVGAPNIERNRTEEVREKEKEKNDPVPFPCTPTD